MVDDEKIMTPYQAAGVAGFKFPNDPKGEGATWLAHVIAIGYEELGIDVQLSDDGTLDTVIAIEGPGGEEEYRYSYEGWSDDDDDDDDGDDEAKYDAFVEWALEDAKDQYAEHHYDEARDRIHEIADGEVPVYYNELWETWVDLGGYHFDGEIRESAEIADDPNRLPQADLYEGAVRILMNILDVMWEQ